MNRQRALVMEAFSLERERAIGAIVGSLATERNALLQNFEWQLLSTLKWATAERREAITDVSRDLAAAVGTLRNERAVLTDDLRHLVDTVLLRVALFLVVVVVLAPLVAHVYARVWPRRWREAERELPAHRGPSI